MDTLVKIVMWAMIPFTLFLAYGLLSAYIYVWKRERDEGHTGQTVGAFLCYLIFLGMAMGATTLSYYSVSDLTGWW